MLTKLVVVGVYVVVLVIIGLYSSRRIGNVGDFFIGGRKIGPWVSAFAYGTTYFSAVMFVGYAGKLGWGFGMHTMWIVAGNVLVGSLLAWLVLAKRTRTMTFRLDAITMPEFLSARYNWDILKPIAALIVFIFLVPYSASVYKGLGHLFEANVGISYEMAVAFMAVITGVYLLMGGYIAVTLTDLFQGIIQLCGVAIMVFLIAGPFGLLGAAQQASLPENAPALAAPGPFPGWLVLFSLVIVTSLGAWGLPQMVQKFYSIKRTADIRAAMIISTLFAVVIAGGAYFTGAMSHLYFTAETLPKDPDMIIPQLLALNTPAWFSILILLVVLAASMSTLASLVLVSGAAISIDLLGLRARGKDADSRGVLILRVLCGVFVGFSVVLAMTKVTFIVNLMVISWGALAGVFLAPYIYGLFWKRANTHGAVAAMLAGFGTAVGCFIAWGSPGVPVAGALAIVVPLAVLPIVTLLTPKPDDKHVERCFTEVSEDEHEEKEPLDEVPEVAVVE